MKPQRRIRLAAVPVAVIAAALVWFQARESEPTAALAGPTPVPASAPFSPPPAAEQPPVLPITVAAVAGTGAARGAEQIELCGGDWVEADADGVIDEDALRRLGPLRAARKAVLAAMRNSPSELARVAAPWLAVIDDQRSAAGSATPQCTREPCAPPDAEALQTLAQRAVSSTDPRVYAVAFSACYRRSQVYSSCALLSAQQWARLDPANARPWLYLLGDAVARRDNAARDEALHRIAVSAHMDSGFFNVAASIVDSAAGDDRSLLAASALATDAIGLAAASSVPYSDLMSSCKSVTIASDANRWQTCSAVAELLVERADSLLDHGMGIFLARRLGWPVERTDRLSGEHQQSFTAFAVDAGQGLDPRTASCGDMRRTLDSIRHRAKLGEIGAARERLAKAGISPEELTRIGREQRERREAQERKSASAPTSAR